MGSSFAKAATTISPEFIAHVRLLFHLTLDEIATGRGGASKNGYCSLAIPGYVSAVASVEAFINEMLLSDLTEMSLGPTPILAFRGVLERLELDKKLLLAPQLAFGKTFSRGAQPYQDMAALSRLRPELVHYKMGSKPPSMVRDLAQRGIVARVPLEEEDGGPYPWADRVSTIQGIQWAHDTACATVRALIDMSPDLPHLPLQNFRNNFSEEREKALARALLEAGIGPTSVPP